MVKIEYLDNPLDTDNLLSMLCQPVRNWFKDKFPDFTRPQKLAIPAIMDKKHLLLCSPTGSGKTLTAFLTVIDELVRKALDGKLQKKFIVFTSRQLRHWPMISKEILLDH